MERFDFQVLWHFDRVDLFCYLDSFDRFYTFKCFEGFTFDVLAILHILTALVGLIVFVMLVVLTVGAVWYIWTFSLFEQLPQFRRFFEMFCNFHSFNHPNNFYKTVFRSFSGTIWRFGNCYIIFTVLFCSWQFFTNVDMHSGQICLFRQKNSVPVIIDTSIKKN